MCPNRQRDSPESREREYCLKSQGDVSESCNLIWRMIMNLEERSIAMELGYLSSGTVARYTTGFSRSYCRANVAMFLFCTFLSSTCAQTRALRIGDLVPPLKLGAILQGEI